MHGLRLQVPSRVSLWPVEADASLMFRDSPPKKGNETTKTGNHFLNIFSILLRISEAQCYESQDTESSCHTRPFWKFKILDETIPSLKKLPQLATLASAAFADKYPK